MDLAAKGEYPEQLKRLVPLNTLSEQGLAQLLARVRIEQVGKGDFLFQEGDTDPQNIYLLSGKVALLLGAKEMDVVSAGTETARFALAHQLPRKFSARAKTKIEYVRIDSRLLSDLLAQTPQESYRVSDIDTEAGDDWMSQLLQSRVFQQIPAANIQGVMMRMEEVEVKKGEVIVRQGDEGDYFYLINTGSCSVTHAAGGGPPVEVARLGAGKSFGEEALLSDKPRSCTITMLGDGKLLRLRKQDFVDLIKRPLSKGLSYAQASSRVAKGEGLWLDVRTPAEHDAGHIAGSLNLPLNTIRIQSASLAPERSYFLYCDNGRQSAAAAYLLTGLGFAVEVLEGGLKEVPAEALEKAGPVAAAPVAETAATEIEAEGAGDQTRKPVADLSAIRGVVEKAKLQIAALKKEKQEALNAQQQLQERLQALEQQHAAWLAQQENLRTALATQQAQAEAATQARAEAEAKLSALAQRETAERGQLEGQKAEREKILAEAAEARAALETRLAALEAERERQVNRLAELEGADKSRADTQAELTRLKETLAAAQSRAQEVEAALVVAEQARAQAQNRVDELEQDRSQQLARLEKLANADEALAGTVAELGRLQDQAQAAAQARAALEARIAELEAARTSQQARLAELEQADAALADTSAELTRLRQELATTTAHAQEDAAALAQTREELTALHQEQQETAQVLDASAQARATLEARIAELEVARTSQQARLAELEQADAALADTSAELTRLRQELATTEKRAAESEATLADASARLIQLQADLAALQQQQQDTEQARETAQRAGFELQARIRALEEEREQQQFQLAELAKTDQALAGSVAEMARLKSELTTLRTQAEEAELALAEAEQTQARLQDRIDALEQERTQQQTRLGELEHADATLAGTAAQLAEAQAALVALQTQAREAEQALGVSEQARAAFETRLAEFEVTQATQQGRLSELEHADQALADSATELARLNEELAALTAQRDAVEQQLLDSDDEKARLQEQVELLAGEIEQLRATLKQQELAADAGEELASLRLEIDHVRSQARAELAAVQAELAQAQKKLAERLERAGADSAEQEAMRQELASLRAALEQRQRELDAATHAQRGLEDSLEERHGQLERLKQTLVQAQTDAEEAGFQRQEAVAARKQVEEALLRYQEEIEAERVRNAGVLAAQPVAEPVAKDSGPGWKAILLGSALGAFVTFVVLEGVALVAGRGELISGLLSAPSVEAPAVADKAPSRSEPAPPAVTEAPPAAAPAATPAAAQPALPRTLRDRLPGNEFGPVMLGLAGGAYTMGSTRDQLARDERPAHRVELKPFFMGQYEVTFEEYDAFARATGRPLPNDEGWGRGNRPVINITWDEAVAYGRWLSQQTGATYRLPTEAEWEYAAAGGSGDLYWWGFDLGKNRANCFDCGSKWGGTRTAPVDGYEPNPYGLYNTAGNVMEWVQDCYYPNYEGAPADGRAWEKDGCEQRVLRGGAYNKPGKSMGATKRAYNSPDVRVPYAGFRLVRER